MHRPLRNAAALGSAGALMLLTACVGGQDDSSSSSANTDTLRTVIDVPASFNPVRSQGLPDYLAARTSFDTVVRRDDSGLVPGLAASWTTTLNSAELKIRTGATCSDGTPITPTIVSDSLNYFASAEGNGVNVAEVFGPGNAKPEITADDDAGTVSIQLKNPWPHLITGLALSSTGIICPAGIADPEGLNAGHVDGAESGPYVLTASEAGVRYTYTLRDDYDSWPEWTTKIPGKPAKKLEYLVSPDSTATANLVLGGQLDAGVIQSQTIDRFKGKDDYKIVTNPFSDYYLVFNERSGKVFADEAKRRGVIDAIDRSAFAKVTSDGRAELATSLVSKINPCVPETNSAIPKTDTAAAAKALAGVKIRFVGPTVIGPAGAGNEYVAESLRAAGATVDFDNTDVGTWISRVLGEPDAWDLTVFADLNFLGSVASTVDSFIGPTIENGGGNFSGVSNPDAEKAYLSSLSTATEDEGCQLVNQAVDTLIERSDVLPLINDPHTYVVRSGFSYQELGGALDDPIFRIRD